MTDASLRATFSDAAAGELNNSLSRIRHCVNQLGDEQLWWRPDQSMNSIANLLLHLSGNVRQWIVAGVGGVPDIRERQKEFDTTGSISRSEIMERIENAVSDAREVLIAVTSDNLVRKRTVQGFEVTGLHAIIHSVAHFQGHTQEIVHITRCQLGDSYQFDFVPNEDQR